MEKQIAVIIGFFLVLVIFATIFMALSFGLMVFWNSTIPEVFDGVSTLTYLNALGLSAMVFIVRQLGLSLGLSSRKRQ